MSLSPEKEKQIRDYVNASFDKASFSHLVLSIKSTKELLDEIDRLRDCLKGHKLAINNLNDGLNLLKKTYGLLDEIKHFKHKKELQ